LSVRALEVLANTADSAISVCADQWQLSPHAREAVQAFLSARRDLLAKIGDTEAPAAPAAEPNGASDAPAVPPADPGAAPAAPTGTFPASPEAAPAAPPPTPGKAAKPKK
jgi:hypothetical protein